ncbi:MBG domain-containing protein [Mucilaginibacter pedocola]|uniref:Secretion system C-terminal sorting domain-containing protein n=1 Tax=Mucilaginibacter pedocola TaxID=1792845 RepID=A0A1S9P8M6_9SPHI|nr:MBG domain-containing protein [Mucilaginibacter pedocola]OOQ57316.1 hypothetical protein BC343_14475 [Mucilaginibacter pedocola]
MALSRIKLFASIVLMLAFATNLRAQTHVSGEQSGTWTKAASPYILDGSINIPAGATLTIAAGVEVQSYNYYDQITVDGVLIANGTATDSIRFKGFETNAASGYTHGGRIVFQSTGTTMSALQYVAMDKWGDTYYYGDRGAIVINTSSATISNSRISNSEGSAIMLGANLSNKVTIASAKITGSGANGITIGQSTAALVSGISFSNNAKDIQAYPSSVGGLSGLTGAKIYLSNESLGKSSTIPKPGTGSVYVLESGFTIPSAITLTIAAGVEIQSYFYSDQITVDGVLIAKGTATDSIRFKGFESNAASGYTHGGRIVFQSAGATMSAMQYVAMDRWGDTYYYGDRGAIVINTSSATISNSRISGSEGSAIMVAANLSNKVSISASKITGNGGNGITIAQSTSALVSTIAFAGNGRDIQAYPSSVGGLSSLTGAQIYLSNESIGKSSTIPKPGTGSVYVLEGGFTIPSGITLTIAAGTEVQSKSVYDNITVDGVLIAKGTVADSIRFTGFETNAANGYTHGGRIVFQSTGATSSALQYVAMDRWGDTYYYGDRGAIAINSSKVSISNTNIRNSEGSGIKIAQSFSPSLSSLAFANNSRDIQAFPSGVSGLSSLTNTAIYLTSESLGKSATMAKPGTGSYYMLDGGFTIPDGITLTIAAGTEIRSQSVYDNITVDGALIAKGTAADSIRFIGIETNAASGYTHGGRIVFQSAGTVTSALQYVAMDRMGDTYYYGDRGAIAVNSSKVSISNSSVRNSEGTAIKIGQSFSPVISSIKFSNNIIDVTAYPSSVGGFASLTNTAIGLGYESMSTSATIPKPGTGSRYVLDGGFNIPDGVTLTIAPGVEIQSKNYTDRITVDGALIAKGTITDSIRFKGFANPNNANLSHGGQLLFQSNGTIRSSLDYVAIDRMGETSYYGDRGAVNINTSTISISNSSVRNSKGIGINISSGNPSVANVVFSGNERAVVMDVNNASSISNLKNASVYLINSSVEGTKFLPYPGLGSYYVLQGGLSIPEDAKLTIQPKVEIQSKNYYDLIDVYGKLTAVGTQADSIRFIGFASSGHNNGGVMYFRSGSDSSQLRYVVMDRWGDVSNGSSGPGVAMRLNSTIKLSNSVVRNSYSQDIDANPNNVGNISDMSNASIYLNYGSIEGAKIFPYPGPGSKYILQGGLSIPEDAKLTVQPKTEIQSKNYSDLIDVYGQLTAVGTQADSIRFIGFANSGHNNGGVMYFRPGSDSSQLRYVVMDRWGDVSNGSSGPGVAMRLNSTIKLSNSVVRNSYSQDIDANPNNVGNISDMSNASIYLNYGSIEGAKIFPYPGPGSKYILQGGISIPEDAKLTIQPKTEIQSKNYNDLIDVYGTLNAIGNEADSIRFTGFANSGHNNGGVMYLRAGSKNSQLKYIVMDGWGDVSNGYSGPGISMQIASNITLSNSTVRNSYYGAIQNSASPKITETSLYGNKVGFYNTAGKPTLLNSKIYSNSEYGVNNTGADTVDARSSYWGDPSGPLHTTLNPQGKGNKVSNKVLFIPWVQQTTQVDQTVNLAAIPTQFVGDTLRLNATATSALPVTYSIVTVPASGVAALAAGNLLLALDTGKVTLTAKQAGSAGFKPAQAQQTFNVTRRAQTITFAALPSKKEGDAPFKLVATSSSGLKVAFAVTSGPATIKNDTLRITAPGNVVITASQAGNKFYNAAAAVQQSFTVVPKLPDLAVKNVLANKVTIITNDSVTVSWTVANDGSLASNGDWAERIYMQGIAGENRTFLKQVGYSGASLAIAKTVARSTKIGVPTQLNIGDKGVFVVELVPGATVQEEGNGANNTGVQATSFNVRKMLNLALSAGEVTEGSSISGVVSRTGSLSAALSVRLSVVNTAKFTIPATVTIPAGQAGASFTIAAPNNNLVEGPIADSLTAAATSFFGTKSGITMLDNDVAALSITSLPSAITEGGSVTFRVNTNLAPKSPLTVYLTSGNQKRFPVPASVIIPTGALYVDVPVTVAQNTTPEIAVEATVSAGAAEREPAIAKITVNDDDIPNLELIVQSGIVSEGAGAYATQATLRRTGTGSSNAFTVNLSASVANALLLPATVSLAAGENEKTFDIGVVDNSIVDGQRTVVINASLYIASCGCSAPPTSSGSVSASMVISDNDGPALTTYVAQQTFAEGVANAGYVRFSRNTPTNSALTLTLTSSDTKEVTLPATAVIPAGQTYVDVPITTKDDGLADGSKKVYLKATAAGFATGVIWVMVTDINKPDLQVAAAKLANATVNAGALINYQLTIKNTGSATAPSGVLVRAYLSQDDAIDAGDVVLAESVTKDGIPAGQTREVLNAVAAPAATGNYKVLFWVNPNDSPAELLSTNNISQALPINIISAYTATAQVAPTYVLQGSTIAVTGTAVTGTAAVANKPVEVYIITNGLRRTIAATTNEAGKFTAQFSPLATEAGHYTVGASFPGLEAAAEQDAFDIVGVKLNGGETPQILVTQKDTLKGTLKVQNLSGRALGNFTLANVKLPAGAYVKFEKLASLPANATVDIKYSIYGATVTNGDLFELATLRAASNEGTIQNFDLYYYCRAANANLVADVDKIDVTASSVKGERQVEIKLTNKGLAASGPVTVALPQAAWLSSVTPKNLPSLAPGDTTTVVLKFLAAAEVPFDYPINGNLKVSAQNAAALSVPFTFKKVSSATGTVKLTATDQFTFYSQGGPNVKNAHVQIKNYFTGQVYADGYTDSTGIYTIAGIPEGKHSITVEKEKHKPYSGTVTINPGSTVAVSAFLDYQAITFDWKVTPTAIQDNYTVTLETKFETEVPKPVVIIDMPKVMPKLTGAQTFAFNVTLTNYGLITAEKVSLSLPDNDPEYEFVMNYVPTDLAARQSIQVPVLMRLRTTPAVAGGIGGFSFGRIAEYFDIETAKKFAQQGECHPITLTAYTYKCNFETGLWEKVTFPFEYENRNCYEQGSALNPDGTLNLSKTGLYGLIYTWAAAGGAGNVTLPRAICLTCGGLNPADPEHPYEIPAFLTEKKGCNTCLTSIAGAVVSCIPVKEAYDKYKLAADLFLCGLGKFFEHSKAREYFDCLRDAAGDHMMNRIIPWFGCLRNTLTAINTCGRGVFQNPNARGVASLSLPVDSGPDAALAEIAANLGAVESTFDMLIKANTEYYGELAMNEAWQHQTGLFKQYIDSRTTIPASAQNSIISAFAGYDVQPAAINAFFTRWNTSITALNENVLAPNTKYPNIINWTKINSYADTLVDQHNYAISKGYESIADMHSKSYQDLDQIINTGKESVCASVSVQFKQQAALTREAFEGNLRISNGHPTEAMKQLSVDISITDENGIPSNGLFQIEQKSLDNLSDVSGNGQISAQATGGVNYLFIPTLAAAPTAPKIYFFGGSVTYFDPYAQAVVTLPLSSVPITVNPGPNLALHYFMNRNILGDDPLTAAIEPSVPGELVVMVQNQGYGAAVNMSISSAQPKIVDNEKGLAIEFKLTGSNFQGQPQKLGVENISFGPIPAMQSRVGQWYFTSSLLGKFVSYDANVVHDDSYGNPNLSLINSVKLHELTKSIKLYGNDDDGINDFLVNDIFDVNSVPDIIYFSQGNRTAKVNPAKSGSFSAPVAAPTFKNVLTVAAVDTGYNYIKLPDPGNNLYDLQSVIRSDGQVIPLDNAWLTFVTLPLNQKPVYENNFHFVDRFTALTPVTYNVVWKPKNLNVPKVDSIYNVPQQLTATAVKTLKVVFNKRIDPATFDYTDLSLTLQGGSNLINSSALVTQVDSSSFNIDISALTTGNGFYTFTVQAAGIADMYGTKGLVGKQASWNQYPTTPAVQAFQGIPDNRLAASYNTMQVLFNLPVTGVTPARFIIKKGGVVQSGSVVIDSVRADGKLFYLSGLGSILIQSGDYDFIVDLPNIKSADNKPGLAQQSVTLTVDKTGPQVLTLEKSNEEGFESQQVTYVNFKFNEPVAGFNTSALKLTRNGTTIPLAIGQLSSTDGQAWRLGNLGIATLVDGSYVLTINQALAKDAVGNAGTGTKQLTWSVSHTPLVAISQLVVTPDKGYSSTDGITSGLAINVALKLSAVASKLTIAQQDASGQQALATFTNMAAGDVSVPVTLAKGGDMKLVITATDKNGLSATAEKALFVDDIPLTAKWNFADNQTLFTQVDAMAVNFSDKLLNATSIPGALQLTRNGVVVPSSSLTIQPQSETLYNIIGLAALSSLPGNYKLSLNMASLNKYSSGIAGTTAAVVSWAVSDNNRAPVANAGTDITATTAGQVKLNGSASADPDSDALTYSWTAPAGITLSDPSAASPTFTLANNNQKDTLSFLLVVSDGKLSTTDVVTVYVNMTTAPLVFNTLAAKTYGDADFSAGATSGNGAVTYSLSSAGVVSISSAGLIRIITAGTVNITATDGKTSITRALVVSKAPVVVTVDSQSKEYGDANPAFTVSYTGLKNNNTDAVFATKPTVSTSATTASPAGSYALTASGASSTRYTFTYVAGTLTVTKATLQITAGSVNKAYGSANPALTVTYTGFKNGETATALTTQPKVSTTAVTASPVGTYPVTVSGAASANYAISYVAGTLTVRPATLTITAASPARVYGDANPALTVTYTGFKNSETAASLTKQPTVSTTATIASPAGTYPVTASGAVSANYTISYVAGTLTVTPAALTITAVNKSKVYGTANPALTLTYAGFKNSETATALSTQPAVSTTSVTASPVGTYPITVSGAASANYTISYVSGTLTVTPADLLISANDFTRSYGSANPALTLAYSGFVNGDNAANLTTQAKASTTATTTSPAGGYAITVTGAASPNYAISYTDGLLTVSKAALKITAVSPSRVYGAANPALTVAYTGFKNGESASALSTLPTISTTAKTTSPVGTYPVTAKGASANNYTISYVAGTLTVTPASLTITAADVAKTYGAANPPLAAIYSGFVNGETESALATQPALSTTAVTASPAGNYPVTVSGAASSNYTISYVNGTLRVGAAPLLIEANDLSKTYGSANPALTLSYTGFVNGETQTVFTKQPMVTTTATTTSPAGAYPITVSGATAANYAISYAPGLLTVNKAALKITAANQTKVYGEVNPALTFTYTGFKNSETATVLTTQPIISTTATTTSAVGNYPITVKGASSANYTISYVAGTLTVNPAALTVTAPNLNKTYGSANPALTVTYSGFKNGETAAVLTTQPVVTTTATTASAVGTYPVTVAGAASPNYTISYVAGTLKINPADLLVEVADATRAYGSANPAFTLTYTGFVNGESATTLTTQAKASTTATATSPAGGYAITVSGAASPNYSISYTNGLLTVSKAALKITAASLSKVYGAANPTLTATYTGFKNGEGTSVLSTQPTLSTTATASSPVGTYPITAKGASANNYTISYVAGTLTVTQPASANIAAVNKPDAIMKVETNDAEPVVNRALSPNGDGINDVFTIENIGNFADNKLVIIDKGGNKVFEASRYDNQNNAFDGHANVGGRNAMLAAGTYFYVLEYKQGNEMKRKAGYLILKY